MPAPRVALSVLDEAGNAYPDRESPRVNAWVEIERRHVWGSAGSD